MDLSDLLGPEPLSATSQEVKAAADTLEKALPQPVPYRAPTTLVPRPHGTLPHAKYKRFDPLNQFSNSGQTNFNIPTFGTPFELAERIDLFFQEVESLEDHMRTKPTLSALAMHLNISRKTLLSLEEKPIYGPIIQAAKTRLESYLEEMLLDGQAKNSSGVSLMLKNGFEWKEKQEVSGELNFSVTRQMFSQPQPEDPTLTINQDTPDA